MVEVLLDYYGYAAKALNCAVLFPPGPAKDRVCVHLGGVSTILARSQDLHL
jgi:hypothetical protein